MGVLVDTSVFIDFFRGKEPPAFKDLLLNNQIFLSHFVRLELLQGVRKQELHTIEYVLGGLEMIPHQEEIFEVSEKLLHKLKGAGLNLGIIDLFLAAESILMSAPIYSFDRVFEKLARQRLIQLFEPN